MATNCCDENVSVKIPALNIKLIGTNLYVMFDGITQIIPMASLGGGGGIGNLTFTEHTLTVSEDGQSYFPDVIPNGETLISLSVNGKPYTMNLSYTIIDDNITWSGPHILEVSDTVTFLTWK